MTVGELKNLLAGVPNTMEVVVSGRDHSYCYTGRGSGIVQAEMHDDEFLSEYYDDDNKSDPKNPVVEVFWIDDGRY
jgi:hypothetical protein